MSAAPIAPVARPGLTIIRRRSWLPPELSARIDAWEPRSGLGWLVRDAILKHRLPAEAAAELLDAITRCVVVESALSLVKIDGRSGVLTHYGIVSRKVVTTAGVNFIVSAFQGTVEPEILRYHGLGTGTTAEAIGDTALVTELTTEYNPNSTRATGSLTQGATANIFRSIGTNTLDSGTPAVTEHGIFSAASGGTLLDRSVFSAINLVGASGDGLQSTYDLTFTAGS